MTGERGARCLARAPRSAVVGGEGGELEANSSLVGWQLARTYHRISADYPDRLVDEELGWPHGLGGYVAHHASPQLRVHLREHSRVRHTVPYRPPRPSAFFFFFSPAASLFFIIRTGPPLVFFCASALSRVWRRARALSSRSERFCSPLARWIFRGRGSGAHRDDDDVQLFLLRVVVVVAQPQQPVVDRWCS